MMHLPAGMSASVRHGSCVSSQLGQIAYHTSRLLPLTTQMDRTIRADESWLEEGQTMTSLPCARPKLCRYCRRFVGQDGKRGICGKCWSLDGEAAK